MSAFRTASGLRSLSLCVLMLSMGGCAGRVVLIQPPPDVTPAITASNAEQCVVSGVSDTIILACLQAKERKLQAALTQLKDTYSLYLLKLKDTGTNLRDLGDKIIEGALFGAAVAK